MNDIVPFPFLIFGGTAGGRPPVGGTLRPVRLHLYRVFQNINKIQEILMDDFYYA